MSYNKEGFKRTCFNKTKHGMSKKIHQTKGQTGREIGKSEAMNGEKIHQIC